MAKVGDRVRPSCEKHADCKGLTGTVIDIRTGNFYTHQVKWDQKEKSGWYSERGLEVIRHTTTIS